MKKKTKVMTATKYNRLMSKFMKKKHLFHGIRRHECFETISGCILKKKTPFMVGNRFVNYRQLDAA